MTTLQHNMWALKAPQGYVRDPHYRTPLRTLLFRTREHAEQWLQNNSYWVGLKVEPVRVNITIAEPENDRSTEQ